MDHSHNGVDVQHCVNVASMVEISRRAVAGRNATGYMYLCVGLKSSFIHLGRSHLDQVKFNQNSNSIRA